MLNNVTNSTYNCMLIVCINYSPWKHINFKQLKKKEYTSKKHFFFCLLPAIIFTHVHQVDALSMQTEAIHVRATLCY